MVAVLRERRQMDNAQSCSCCQRVLCACPRLVREAVEYDLRVGMEHTPKVMMKKKYISLSKSRLPAWMFTSRVGGNLETHYREVIVNGGMCPGGWSWGSTTEVTALPGLHHQPPQSHTAGHLQSHITLCV